MLYFVKLNLQIIVSTIQSAKHTIGSAGGAIRSPDRYQGGRFMRTIGTTLILCALAACGSETVGDSRDYTCRDGQGNPVGHQVHVSLDPTTPQGTVSRTDGMTQMARITVWGTAPTGCTPAETKLVDGFITSNGTLTNQIDGLPYKVLGGGGTDVEPTYQAWRLANGAAHFDTVNNQATAIPVNDTRSIYSFVVDLSQVADPGTLQWRLGGWAFQIGENATKHDAIVDSTPGAELTVE